MRLHRRSARRRVGFTLIELLIVIGIIALLVSLLMSAVVKTLEKMDEVATSREVNSLASSMTQFQADFNVQTGAPPSRLYIDESGTYDPSVNFTGSDNLGAWGSLTAQQQVALKQLASDSKNYLYSKLWPRTPLAYDWNGSKTTEKPYILEGQQCLVFFLGGVIVNGNPTGFSTDPRDPMKTSGPRKGPYFQFVSSRLQGPLNGNNMMWQFIDAYGSSSGGQPYAYFSSGPAANNYNAYPTLGSDCVALGITNGAYTQTNAAPFQFYKPDTFQIISAGKNQAFGPGGYWLSSMGASGMPASGGDDITNFYGAKLGVVP
jgi:prepilin-type N-terminal cleavage/methylation domain-containing protein